MDRLAQLSSRLRKQVTQASGDFGLLEPDDHVLVCLSGGKDSYTMLALLRDIRARAPFNFQLTAFHLDQEQPGYPHGIIDEYLESLDIPYLVRERDTYSIVVDTLPEGATPCSLCSRMRRGIIYTTAEELGCNKIALGHHRDDSLETLLLNLTHAGRMQAMPAKYTTDDGRFEVIRPLIYLAEDEIAEYAELMEFPIIPCNLCGSVQTRRKWAKRLLDQIEQTVPEARNNMLAALGNVHPSHLLDPAVHRSGDD
ncbi:tRNA 2-thiocytidine(32) synthetase TtcA [Persicimonas caeni]|uniref:tRNA 2-thiocytidine(32) synthetase TtcA n=1 Tax=Persicimonas caeni TaxID=2292766 RepID=A0A4Y6PZS1_PERCE|nr:tRNA 2-thiocytidine(32) synthetase TtcA [Persicimonas caeni]QDG53814.1 tRNA 2-thiocytidine(32) synthetase TtcA [Persicimonas caeni]QED35035.1 tRNA 2-thiocytidine(32) synthetase TtcA [Persicimonas caeni]